MKIILAFFSFCFLFFGCSPKAPLLTECRPRSKTLDFICSHGDSKKIILPATKVDSFIFTSEIDQKAIQKACLTKAPWPEIVRCSFSSAEMAFLCFSEATMASSILELSHSDGMVGISSADREVFLDFCSP